MSSLPQFLNWGRIDLRLPRSRSRALTHSVFLEAPPKRKCPSPRPLLWKKRSRICRSTPRSNACAPKPAPAPATPHASGPPARFLPPGDALPSPARRAERLSARPFRFHVRHRHGRPHPPRRGQTPGEGHGRFHGQRRLGDGHRLRRLRRDASVLHLRPHRPQAGHRLDPADRPQNPPEIRLRAGRRRHGLRPPAAAQQRPRRRPPLF